MNKKRIFKRIKNGKGIMAFYRKSEEMGYSIRIDPMGDKIQLHTFYFDGNDVTHDESYKDEKIRFFDNLDSLFDVLNMEFPGLDINCRLRTIVDNRILPFIN